jgi:lipopolysaccharide export LptBFGC system permease protein LptF
VQPCTLRQWRHLRRRWWLPLLPSIIMIAPFIARHNRRRARPVIAIIIMMVVLVVFVSLRRFSIMAAA